MMFDDHVGGGDDGDCHDDYDDGCKIIVMTMTMAILNMITIMITIIIELLLRAHFMYKFKNKVKLQKIQTLPE